MSEWQSFYPWFKALHVIAMVCWFAGLFYLPRLFVYHAMSDDLISQQRFEVMERKLYRGIMWPSMILTWVFGLLTLSLNAAYYFSQGWFHFKLLLVVILTFYHLWCGYARQQLLRQPQWQSHVFFRWWNEFPVLILIAVTILVMVKPQLG